MRTSIVTAYHNRKQLVVNTLNSIQRYQQNDLEVIIVDDCSDEEHRLEDVAGKYPFVKLIRLEKEDKWYHCCCIPFNIGFKEASGDIIIIQNPECLHVGDIISYSQKLQKNQYITFGCYSIDNNNTNAIKEIPSLTTENIIKTISGINSRIVSHNGDNGWYNHSNYRPVFYHFCSMMHRRHLSELKGFDERYGKGRGYDDDELLARIKKMGLDVTMLDDPFVIHQNHYSGVAIPNVENLISHNRNILVNTTLKGSSWQAPDNTYYNG